MAARAELPRLQLCQSVCGVTGELSLNELAAAENSQLLALHSAREETTATQRERARPHEAVKVAVRVRPPTDGEVADGDLSWSEPGRTCTVLTATNPTRCTEKTYYFDNVIPQHGTQEDVFDMVGRPMVLSVLEGFNACCLAYGQTGSGKTHTMLGSSRSLRRSSELVSQARHIENTGLGLVPRVAHELFKRIADVKQAAEDGTARFACVVSMFQIYDNKGVGQISDLIDTRSSCTGLSVSSNNKEVKVEGLSAHNVATEEDVMKLFSKGVQNRNTRETVMNKESSRSHMIFCVRVERRSVNAETGVETLRYGTLYLVDLAGSERVKQTEASGVTFKEAVHINQSLHVLGRVIQEVVNSQSPKFLKRNASRKPPYRESTLTRFLQPCIGGNAKTFLIANVSNVAGSSAMTRSTLEFASKAREVRNAAAVNTGVKGAHSGLQAEVARLQQENLQLSAKLRHLQGDITARTAEALETVHGLRASIDADRNELIQARLSVEAASYHRSATPTPRSVRDVSPLVSGNQGRELDLEEDLEAAVADAAEARRGEKEANARVARLEQQLREQGHTLEQLRAANSSPRDLKAPGKSPEPVSGAPSPGTAYSTAIAAQGALAEVKRDYAKLQAENRTLTAKMRATSAMAEQAQSERDSLIRKVHEAKEATAEAQSKLAQYRNDFRDMIVELEESKQAAQEAERQKEELLQKLDEVELVAAEAQWERDDLLEKLQEEEVACQQAQEELHTCQEEYRKLVVELKETLEHMHGMQSKCSTLEHHVASSREHYAATMSSMRRELTASKSEVRDARLRISDLESQLVAAQKQSTAAEAALASARDRARLHDAAEIGTPPLDTSSAHPTGSQMGDRTSSAEAVAAGLRELSVASGSTMGGSAGSPWRAEDSVMEGGPGGTGGGQGEEPGSGRGGVSDAGSRPGPASGGAGPASGPKAGNHETDADGTSASPGTPPKAQQSGDGSEKAGGDAHDASALSPTVFVGWDCHFSSEEEAANGGTGEWQPTLSPGVSEVATATPSLGGPWTGAPASAPEGTAERSRGTPSEASPAVSHDENAGANAGSGEGSGRVYESGTLGSRMMENPVSLTDVLSDVDESGVLEHAASHTGPLPPPDHFLGSPTAGDVNEEPSDDFWDMLVPASVAGGTAGGECDAVECTTPDAASRGAARKVINSFLEPELSSSALPGAKVRRSHGGDDVWVEAEASGSGFDASRPVKSPTVPVVSTEALRSASVGVLRKVLRHLNGPQQEAGRQRRTSGAAGAGAAGAPAAAEKARGPETQAKTCSAAADTEGMNNGSSTRYKAARTTSTPEPAAAASAAASAEASASTSTAIPKQVSYIVSLEEVFSDDEDRQAAVSVPLASDESSVDIVADGENRNRTDDSDKDFIGGDCESLSSTLADSESEDVSSVQIVDSEEEESAIGEAPTPTPYMPRRTVNHRISRYLTRRESRESKVFLPVADRNVLLREMAVEERERLADLRNVTGQVKIVCSCASCLGRESWVMDSKARWDWGCKGLGGDPVCKEWSLLDVGYGGTGAAGKLFLDHLMTSQSTGSTAWAHQARSGLEGARLSLHITEYWFD